MQYATYFNTLHFILAQMGASPRTVISSIIRCWSVVMVCSFTVSITTYGHAVWSMTSRVYAHHAGSQEGKERTITMG